MYLISAVLEHKMTVDLQWKNINYHCQNRMTF